MGVGSFILPQMGVSNEWQRPTDWLPMPTNITSADQIFVGLHAVIENSDNYCAFSFTTSVGQYRVDWGDGNITLHNSGTIAQYQYNYATIRHSYCEKVEIKTIGNVTSMLNMFNGCLSLQSVPLFNTINVTNMSSMFAGCLSLQSVPLFNTANVTSMANMFQNCQSLQSVPLFNTVNVTYMSTMFYNCPSLQSVPLFNTINVTNMTLMFTNCPSLNFMPAFITTAITSDFAQFANGCNSLNRILMSFNRTVALQGCQLSKDALVEIFTNLVDRTSTTSANIDITGNWGSSALTSAGRAIATNKNYVIIG